jgi:hypothetical protein
MKNILFTLAILISFASFAQIEEGNTYQAEKRFVNTFLTINAIAINFNF